MNAGMITSIYPLNKEGYDLCTLLEFLPIHTSWKKALLFHLLLYHVYLQTKEQNAMRARTTFSLLFCIRKALMQTPGHRKKKDYFLVHRKNQIS